MTSKSNIISDLIGDDPELPLSFPQHVRQQLRDAIIDGALAPGQRVSEEELARTFGVSRTPVREAMRFLESEGLIIHHRGRGATVAERATARDAEILFEARITLESALVRLACEKVTDEEIDRLERVQAALLETAPTKQSDRNADRIKRMASLDAEFHWTVYAAGRSDLLLAIVRSYWGQLMRERAWRDHSAEHPVTFVLIDDRFTRQHEAVLDALRRRDGDAGEAKMAEHIRDTWERMRPH